MQNGKSYPIKAMVQLTGVNERTLRAWEQRYKLFQPKRDANGRRVYDLKDLNRLRLLMRLLNQGHSISHLAQMTSKELLQLEQSSPIVETPPSNRQPKSPIMAKMIQGLESFDLDGLMSSIHQAQFKMSAREFVLQMVLPLLTEVGHRVVAGRLSVAQEHLLSATLRDHLGALYQKARTRPTNSKSKLRIGLTTREGDLHEFGILLSAILAAESDFETFFWGANLPATDVIQACHDFRINILVLGLSELPSRKQIHSPSEYLTLIDQKLPKQIQIWTGGAADPRDWKPSSSRKRERIANLQQLETLLEKVGSM